MSTYGRNFGFRVPPQSEQRSGRYASAASLPIGAPVVYDSAAEVTALGLVPVKLATAAQAPPLPGEGGILVYEYGPAAYAGHDPYLTTYSDLDTCPAGAAVQVVNGRTVKAVYTNTVQTVFLGARTYSGRTMVTGMGATPTVDVGVFLTPGTGTDSAGYWDVTSSESNAWLVVTSFDPNRNAVEVRLTF